jgi:two-component system, OmpR family, alkaline phosphatase synthesis response regulator PhoP
MKKVLIIEDDLDIQELLKIHLIDLECEVTKETNGTNGLTLLQNEHWDLLILDLMLPGLNGLEICKRIRETNKQLPILMLTAKSEEIDKVVGLEIGADDYLTKPFSIREFIARVKALFRRADKIAEPIENVAVLEFNNNHLVIDTENRKVLINNNRIDLTPKEYSLLVLMASNIGRSYSREQLLNVVWGHEFIGYEHTVNSHINRLRIKIEPDINAPTYILTSWGVGYRFSDKITN